MNKIQLEAIRQAEKAEEDFTVALNNAHKTPKGENNYLWDLYDSMGDSWEHAQEVGLVWNPDKHVWEIRKSIFN